MSADGTKKKKRIARMVRDAKEEKEADRLTIGVVHGFSRGKTW